VTLVSPTRAGTKTALIPHPARLNGHEYEVTFNDTDVVTGSGEKGTLGDCWDRFYVRVMEMIESIKIVRWCLANIEPGPVLGDVPKVLKVPPGEAYVGIENPRGELGHYVVSDGGKVAKRCRVRGPSFCNLAVLEAIMPGTLLADSIAIIGSTDVVIGETDR